MTDRLSIGAREFGSRLLLGTGKYRDFEQTRAAVEASGAEIITVAIRRTNIGQKRDGPRLLEVLPPSKFTLLPNSAGCYTAEDAVRTLRLGACSGRLPRFPFPLPTSAARSRCPDRPTGS